jgi:hypothetical protein
MSSYLAALLVSARADLDNARTNLAAAEDAQTFAMQALNNANSDVEHYQGKVSEIVQAIKTLEGTKGFKPNLETLPSVENTATEEPDYNGMTIRQSLRTYFLTNGNEPTYYRTLSEVTGKSKNSTASVLSIYPEFIRSHEGHWMMAPDYFAQGWTIVGK